MALGLSLTEMINLVPEATGWHGGVFGWIVSTGSYSALIGSAELLWPDFAVHDDCVLRAPVDEGNHRAWMDQLGEDREKVERVCNHLHLSDLIDGQSSEATDDQLSYVGRLLQDMWQSKLARDFPDRRFAVEFHEDPSDPDDDPIVLFYQIRND